MNPLALAHAAGISMLVTAQQAMPAILGAVSSVSTQTLTPRSPVDAAALFPLTLPHGNEVAGVVSAAVTAFQAWRSVPAPRRGELVRQIGHLARQRKEGLAKLITLEAGKIHQEALGEVQEMIDVCDFAVGLSRQLYGLTIASERPGHRMMEQWHPLGPVGVITAFNFPMAVWAWNAMLALVCGDPVIWKPSEQTPLCAMACHQLVVDAAAHLDDVPEHLSQVVQGGREIGAALSNDPRLPLISATGSCAMGKQVARAVAGRLGRSLLELGGNNAMIVTASADLDLALRAMVFSAVGTTGQRCTSLRRVIAHESITPTLLDALSRAYASLKIGNPFDDTNLLGPLVNETAWEKMQNAMAEARSEGGSLVCGGERLQQGVPSGGCYVSPAIMKVPGNIPVVREETFAPLLYVMSYRDLDEAIQLQNDVPQGLSSAIFTNTVHDAEQFMGPTGSDCGIANVNIGTSGAEIGGAFGGEKDTGGGRESGSDAWKNYMRRATNTINYSAELPLAQGIRFDL